MSEKQCNGQQQQYEAMQKHKQALHDKTMSGLRSECLSARHKERKVEDEARENLIKARMAESIAQDKEEDERLRGTCTRLRGHRNEVQAELEEVTEKYDELVNGQTDTVPMFGGVTTPATDVASKPTLDVTPGLYTSLGRIWAFGYKEIIHYLPICLALAGLGVVRRRQRFQRCRIVQITLMEESD